MITDRCYIVTRYSNKNIPPTVVSSIICGPSERIYIYIIRVYAQSCDNAYTVDQRFRRGELIIMIVIIVESENDYVISIAIIIICILGSRPHAPDRTCVIRVRNLRIILQ